MKPRYVIAALHLLISLLFFALDMPVAAGVQIGAAYAVAVRWSWTVGGK